MGTRVCVYEFRMNDEASKNKNLLPRFRRVGVNAADSSRSKLDECPAHYWNLDLLTPKGYLMMLRIARHIVRTIVTEFHEGPPEHLLSLVRATNACTDSQRCFDIDSDSYIGTCDGQDRTMSEKFLESADTDFGAVCCV